MSKKIIPGPAFLPPEPAVPTDTFGPAGSLFALPLTEPGEVADLTGDLWLDTFGDRLSHGELTVTPEQARAAARTEARAADADGERPAEDAGTADTR